MDEIPFVSVLDHDEFANEFKVLPCFVCDLFSV